MDEINKDKLWYHKMITYICMYMGNNSVVITVVDTNAKTKSFNFAFYIDIKTQINVEFKWLKQYYYNLFGARY